MCHLPSSYVWLLLVLLNPVDRGSVELINVVDMVPTVVGVSEPETRETDVELGGTGLVELEDVQDSEGDEIDDRIAVDDNDGCGVVAGALCDCDCDTIAAVEEGEG